MCPGQLAPNAFTVINVFYVAFHLVNELPLLEVFSQFYNLTKPKDQFLFSLTPPIVKIESRVQVKFGCHVMVQEWFQIFFACYSYHPRTVIYVVVPLMIGFCVSRDVVPNVLTMLLLFYASKFLSKAPLGKVRFGWKKFRSLVQLGKVSGRSLKVR